MAEYVCAKLAIGGELPSSLVADLWSLVAAERAGPDWGLRFRDDTAFEQHLRDGAEYVTFYGDEVRNGEFERIQAFCIDHGLTYVLTYDGCGGEWGPARRRWRPTDAEAITCPLDADGGKACLTADEIRRRSFASVATLCAHLSEFDDEVCPPLVLIDD